MREVILFTANFPYGSSETFLETEIYYLAKHFDKVTIVVSHKNSETYRPIPTNCELIILNLDYSIKNRILSVFNLFSTKVILELYRVKKVYKQTLSFARIKTVLMSLQRAKKVDKFIQSHQTSSKNQKIYYSYWCDDTALGIALASCSNPSIVGLSRMHRWDIYFEESQINYLPFRIFITDYLKCIYSISEDGIKYAKSNWLVKSDKFALSRLGTANDIEYKIPTNKKIHIVSCSNIISVKQVHKIAEALMYIKDRPIEWTHFGDGILMNELKIKVHSLPDNIQVNLPGRIPNRQILQAYQEINPSVFINLSSSEGVPVSIMEAMSFGIPCLAFDVGGNSEIVNNHNGALLSSSAKPEVVASKILDIIDHFDTKSKEAYYTWIEKYNADKNYEDFCRCINKI